MPTSNFPESEMTWASNSSSQFTNSYLPPLFLKGRKWAKLFLLTLLLWIRDQPNIWSVPEDNLVHTLTEIAKVMYPTFNTLDNICPNMPIFAVESQCLSGWCHSLGSMAITLVDCYLASNSDMDVKWTCNAFLNKQAFAYEDLDSSSLDKAFHRAFVLQLLANAHLHSCARSVDVPPLGLTPKTYKARGAIALCVTALKCAIKLMKSKSVSSNVMEKGRGSANQVEDQQMQNIPSWNKTGALQHPVISSQSPTMNLIFFRVSFGRCMQFFKMIQMTTLAWMIQLKIYLKGRLMHRH
ncbi:hypothetical protein BKA83DRAFT_4500262 [Pisolithus microcarpus]|nr:hypothetical protein BKA83DRAFT_4500262 [Pisolithus microcarpus]